MRPAIDSYLQHYLALAAEQSWDSDTPADIAARDARHMELFFSDELDPRAWNGVYRIVGEDIGRQIKNLIQLPKS